MKHAAMLRRMTGLVVGLGGVVWMMGCPKPTPKHPGTGGGTGGAVKANGAVDPKVTLPEGRDARLAFFPAVTNRGTLWFSTPGRAAAYLGLGEKLSPNDARLAERPELIFGMGDFFAMDGSFSNLRVSWISITGLPCEPETIGDEKLKLVVKHLSRAEPGSFPHRAMWEAVVKRTILLDETTFYRVVETCLERRTCNKINEDTGTVEEGALFSYEALPRNSYLYTRLSWDLEDFEAQHFLSPMHVCDLAREGLARMGIGGLQTRGLGSVLVESLVENGEES